MVLLETTVKLFHTNMHLIVFETQLFSGLRNSIIVTKYQRQNAHLFLHLFCCRENARNSGLTLCIINLYICKFRHIRQFHS